MSLVLVTGASGYVGSHVVKALLEAGYRVRGTVRDKSNEKKVAHLVELGSDLELVEADLLDKESLRAAVKGCDYVVHTASPFFMKVDDPQRDLVDPAVNGTRGILEAVNEESSVKRVVLTSSIVAVLGNADAAPKDRPLNESDWNKDSSLTNSPYGYSKRLAEEAAWEIVGAQSRYDLVTVNPSFVMGAPLSSRTDGESVQFVMNLLNGKYATGVADITLSIVDVLDVALAHVKALDPKVESGRYICTSDAPLKMAEIAQLLKKEFPQRKISSKVAPKTLLWLFGPLIGLERKWVTKNVGYDVTYSNSKIKASMLPEMRSAEGAILGMAHYLIEKELVKAK